MAEGLVSANPTGKDLQNVEVVMAIAPDDGSTIDSDTVEIGRADESEEGPSVDDGDREFHVHPGKINGLGFQVRFLSFFPRSLCLH